MAGGAGDVLVAPGLGDQAQLELYRPGVSGLYVGGVGRGGGFQLVEVYGQAAEIGLGTGGGRYGGYEG